MSDTTPKPAVSPESRRLGAILTISVVGWAAFTALNGAKGRPISAAIDLVVTLGIAVCLLWARGVSSRVAVAAHVSGGFNAIGLTVVSLIQGQSAAMASWFLVAAPLYAAYLVGARAAKIWSVLTIGLLAIVHLSGRIWTVKPEFVHIDAEVWGGASVLVLAQLGFALAVIRVQEEDLAAVLLREEIIRQQATDVARARDAALAASRAKDEFLAVMSHEIRTPLNGVLGMAELLATGPLSAGQREQVETILSSGVALRVILGDVLDAAKIEAGQLAIASVPFSLRHALDESVRLLDAEARKKGLSLTSRIGDGVPLGAIGDPVRIRQVLLNLVGNALKFTDEGSVDASLRVDEAEPTDEGTLFHFRVTDTGIGIDEEQLARLFQPFTQVDAASNRRFGGTGLGLSISRRLARMMHGDVWAESELGRGSTFHFTFRATETDAPPVASASQPTTGRSAQRVLVVDDNEVNRRVAAAMLEELGQHTEVVSDGEAALAAVGKRTFDVVLLDMRMPGIDGLETSRRIRRLLDVEAQPWIVAMTANAMASDRLAAARAGMDDFLEKPVSMVDLSGVLGRVGIESARMRGTEGSSARERVVVVEEPDPAAIATLRSLFDGNGLRDLAKEQILRGGELIDELVRAASARDGKAMAAAAHSLRGSSGVFGLSSVSMLCSDVEGSVRAADVDAAIEVVGRLASRWKIVAASLRALA